MPFTSADEAEDSRGSALSGNTLTAEVRMGETTVQGHIYSCSERYIRILLPGPVPLGLTIHATFDEYQVHGTVNSCQKIFGGYQVGFELTNENGSVYRREPRFAVEGTGTLSVLGDQGPNDVTIDLADVSSSGIGIFLDHRLAEQTCVYLRVAHSAIFGEVRNCEPAGSRGGFRLGIRIEIFVPGGTQRVEEAPEPHPSPGLLGLFGFKVKK